MGDKFDGALASGGRLRMIDISLPDAMHDITLHESLLASDDDGNVMILRAMQNPEAGGLMLASQSPEKSNERMIEAIAKSQMLSMLRDSARCRKYVAAITTALQHHNLARVLDIGTGTGLLAKIAAKNGAAHVDAIEMFGTLAQLAREIIAENNLSSKITVHESCSNDMGVKSNSTSPSCNLDDQTESSLSPTEDQRLMIPTRADILVTEIFDSALLGEGCLQSIKHAHEHLLRQNAVVIPAKATVFGVALNSDFLSRFFRLPSHFPLHRSSEGPKCIGYSMGIPIHMDVLRDDQFKVLSDPFQVFTFDFSRACISSCLNRKKTVHVPRNTPGRADVVMTWWELDLCGNGTITYSTKPGTENWQDHWLPMVYPLIRGEENNTEEEYIPVTVQHNGMTMSFAYGEQVMTDRYCTCGLHVASKSPYRLFQVGNVGRLQSLSSRIKEAIQRAGNKKSTTEQNVVRCLDVSDGGVCTALAVGLDTSSTRIDVTSIEEDDEVSSFIFGQIARRVKRGANDSIFEFTPLSSLIEREAELRDNGEWEPFDVLLSEPYTRAMSAYPISTLGNMMVQVRAATQILQKEFITVPSLAEIFVQLLSFPSDTLQNNFDPIDEVEGFKYNRFGAICDLDDWQERERLVSLPLFQYASEKVSEKTCVHRIRLTKPQSFYDVSSTEVKIDGAISAEMISLWVEYDGEGCDVTQRYETIWLTEREKRDVENSGGVVVRSQFDRDSGTWSIGFKPLVVV
ncbi:unnamed protein product [Agarophyton chilense]|eukprot:gb/GEZJ01003460.1/.p1 GENE.gb/GEZJ01003460.1/~~gb/GEZJ01003460.1/.p1  ORF type:complete len:742 (-),score=71.86 gb/GEZJ01003460.1/:2072-4297(-)